MLRLTLSLDASLKSRYAEAARRVRGLQIVEDETNAHAIATQDGESVKRYLEWGQHVLWVPSSESPQISSPSRLMPAAVWRYRSSVREIFRRLESGQLGEPGSLRIHRWSPGASLLSDLDLANAFFSESPLHVYAQSLDDYVQVHLGFASGGMALIDHHTAGHGYESLTLIGSRGAAYADDHHNTNLRLSSSGCEGLTTGEGDTELVALLTEFVQAIEKDRDFAVTLSDIETAKSVLAKVTQSLERQSVA